MLTRPVQIIDNTETHAQSYQTHTHTHARTSFVCFSYVVFETESLTWVCVPGVSGAARRRRHGVVGFSFKIFLERSLILLEPRLKHVFNGRIWTLNSQEWCSSVAFISMNSIHKIRLTVSRRTDLSLNWWIKRDRALANQNTRSMRWAELQKMAQRDAEVTLFTVIKTPNIV